MQKSGSETSKRRSSGIRRKVSECARRWWLGFAFVGRGGIEVPEEEGDGARWRDPVGFMVHLVQGAMRRVGVGWSGHAIDRERERES